MGAEKNILLPVGTIKVETESFPFGMCFDVWLCNSSFCIFCLAGGLLANV